MLKIKNKFGKYLEERFDYELENGIILFNSDWNGEAYIRGLDTNTNKFNNNSFKAIYMFQIKKINLDELEEDSEEWEKATEIIGFEECW